MVIKGIVLNVVRCVCIEDVLEYNRIFSVIVGIVKVSNSVYFSCIDLKSGYHQVHLDAETKHKTAFCAGNRLYEYNRLPFGL